jgi:hypothetical protein
MNPKGHNSVDGRARKWFTPAVNAAVNSKMKVMRASEAVFSDTKKSPHEQAEARKLFTTARNQAATATKKAKQMWQQNVFKAIEEHELKSRKNGHSGAATWKAMNNLGNTYAQPRKVHPVLNKALRYCSAVWAPMEVPAAHARSQWSVTKTATEEAAAAYTTALRTALGTSRHTKSRTIYEAMRLRMAVDIWQSEVLQYWDRLRRMPEDRLARRVYEEAVKSSSSFVARVTAAHQAIFNVPPSWSQAPPGKHKVRKNMNAALDTRGEKEWYDHVRAHEKDGAALYLQVPPPSRSPARSWS